jgi:hypothetical protein
MTKENAILSKLFAGHDAGHFGLPPELLARREAEGRVNDAFRELSARFGANDPAAARSRAVADLIEAAGKGDLPAGYGAGFLEAQDETRRLSAEQSVLTEARAELAERTPWLAARLSEDILADHLRPAMVAVLDRVRSGATIAARVPWDDQRSLVMADKKVREYHELVAAAQQGYFAIRNAQRLLMTLSGAPSTEAYHTFGELRNMPAIWPTRDSGVESIRGRAPWPEGIARMVWLVTSAAEPWLPRAAEVEEAQQERLAANPLRRGGVVAGEQGFVAIQSGSGLDRMRS